MSLHRDWVTVNTPATSANLGPGFDSFGLALTLCDELRVQAVPDRPELLEVVVQGEGADCVPTDESHLVVRSLRAALDAMGVAQPGLRLHCRNRIPHARGLGSSAAAIVGGIVAARALAAEPEPGWDDSWVLRLAADAEGHPDNVAACVYGGMTVAWSPAEGARAVRLDISGVVAPHVLVPDLQLSTDAVRGLLPETVPHAEAARTAGRAGLLVAAMVTGRPDVLLDATEDWLHQPYRAEAMPQSWRLIEALRGAGVAGVISGAGPSVLALTGTDGLPAGLGVPPGWWVPEVAVRREGATAQLETAGLPVQA